MNIRNIVGCIVFTLFTSFYSTISATTYYVRTDGGTYSQCNGLANKPYPGTGSGMNCAVNSPFWLLPVAPRTPVFKGGDTMIIGSGDYMVGYGAPNTTNCSASFPWDCKLANIPGGPDKENPTRILGEGWDTQSGAKPSLWGTQRVSSLLRIGGNNIEIHWLDLTDHSSCLNNAYDPQKRCHRTTPINDHFADQGIVASTGSNILLKDLEIHGLASYGLYVGNIRDWIFEDIHIRGNAHGGINFDIAGLGNPTNSGAFGNIIFRKTTIEYNGCGETYPALGFHGCFEQLMGGYGDGIGAPKTGGNWIFEDSNISHNTSDGLDLAYLRGSGNVFITRSRFEGNNGNQVKSHGATHIENSVIIGNCNYFRDKPFTEIGPFNYCRAGGAAVSVNFETGASISLINNTLYGQGDTLLNSAGLSCDGSEKIYLYNNIFYGDNDITSGNPPIEKTAFYFNSGNSQNGGGSCGNVPVEKKNNIIFNFKNINNICPNTSNNICVDPQFTGPLTGDLFGIDLQIGSIARGQTGSLIGSIIYNSTYFGNIVVPSYDFYSYGRLSQSIDWGAINASPRMITGTISYTPQEWTSGSVVATLMTNTSIIPPLSWTRVNANHFTKTFFTNESGSLELRDRNGATGAVNYDISNIDSISPRLSLLPPIVNIVFTGSDDQGSGIYKYECLTENSGSWNSCDSPLTVTLHEGSNTISVRAIDIVGNISSGTVITLLKNTAP